jgi:hypothetical protein
MERIGQQIHAIGRDDGDGGLYQRVINIFDEAAQHETADYSNDNTPACF